MATIDEIKQQAEAVKNATQVGENTAERVGGALAGLADIAKEQEDNIGKKADKAYMDAELNKKADKAYTDAELNKKADKAYTDAELAKKADKAYMDAELNKKADKAYTDAELAKKADSIAGLSISNAIMPEKDLSYYTQRANDEYYANEIVENVDVIGIFINAAADGKCSIIYVENIDAYTESSPIVTDYDLAKGQNFVPLGKSYKAGGKSQIFVSSNVMLYKSWGGYNRKFFVIQDGSILKHQGTNQVAVGYVVSALNEADEASNKADEASNKAIKAYNSVAGLSISNAIMPEKDLSYYTQRADDKYYANEIVENVNVIGIFINAAADGKCSIIYVENIDAYTESAPIVTDYDLAKGQNFVPLGKSYKAGGKSQIFVSSSVMFYKSRDRFNRKFFTIDGATLEQNTTTQVAVGYVVSALYKIDNKPLDKTFSVLGDSISTYSGFIPSGYAAFYPNGDVDNVNKTWWKQLENLTGYKLLKNASWRGSRVTGTVNDTTGKSGCSTKRANDLSEGNIKPDIIIVYFGINNFGSYLGTYDCKSALPSDNALHEFSKAYAKMLHNVITLYNKAKIYCCTLLPRYNSDTESKIDFPNVKNAPDKDGVTIEDYNRYIIEIAKANGCTVINMNETGMNYANFDLYTIDNLHPNAAGHVLFAKTIAKVINNDK